MEYKKIKDRLDVGIQNLENRLEEARVLLIRHIKRFEKNPIDYHRERTELKQRQIDEMEEKLSHLRSRLHTVIEFNPVQGQFSEIEDRYHPATEKDWEKIPNSKFKIFQDIFAPPGHRILPKKKYVDYNSIDLNDCIVNPEFVPNKFLTEFGLADLSSCPDKLSKLQVKTESKPKIVDFFNHLKPMSPDQDNENKVSNRLLVLEGFDKEGAEEKHDGKIIIPVSRTSNDIHRKIIQSFDSIYSAQRRFGHAEGGYELEKPKIFAVKNRIISILNNVRGLRHTDPEVKTVCDDIRREMDGLKDVKNIHKKGIYDVLQKIQDLKDSLGRHNPGSSAATLVTALNKITDRLEDILGVTSTMDMDRGILNMRINRGEAILDLCFDKFNKICECARNFEETISPIRHDGSLKRREPTPEEIGIMKLRMNTILRSLEDINTLKVRPFNLYAEKLSEKAMVIKDILSKKNRDSLFDSIDWQDFEKVRDTAIKAFIISKIFKVQKERERILAEISLAPEKTDIGYLAEKAEQLLKVVQERQVYPFVETSYEFQYKVEIQEKVEKLARGLRIYEKKGWNTEEKIGMYNQLKTYLEGIDFPSILSELD